MHFHHILLSQNIIHTNFHPLLYCFRPLLSAETFSQPHYQNKGKNVFYVFLLATLFLLCVIYTVVLSYYITLPSVNYDPRGSYRQYLLIHNTYIICTYTPYITMLCTPTYILLLFRLSTRCCKLPSKLTACTKCVTPPLSLDALSTPLWG